MSRGTAAKIVRSGAFFMQPAQGKIALQQAIERLHLETKNSQCRIMVAVDRISATAFHLRSLVSLFADHSEAGAHVSIHLNLVVGFIDKQVKRVFGGPAETAV